MTRGLAAPEGVAGGGLTAEELHVLRHTVAWPKRYRNHFVTGPDTDDWETVQHLVDKRLMKEGRPGDELSGGMPVFYVTHLGIEALKAADAPPASHPLSPAVGVGGLEEE